MYFNGLAGLDAFEGVLSRFKFASA